MNFKLISTFCRGVYHVVHTIIECEKKNWVKKVEQDNLNSFYVFQAWDPIISLLEGNKMLSKTTRSVPKISVSKNKV